MKKKKKKEEEEERVVYFKHCKYNVNECTHT